MTDSFEDVLSFWFGTPADPWFGKPRREWFQKDAAFDDRIRRHFEAVLRALIEGAHEDWLESARGALAYVIVLDQFSRNLFRDDPRAFAQDAQARRAAASAIERELDRQMDAQQRCFLYMPFMHSEHLGDQDRCVALFESLGEEGRSNLDYAHKHRAIVARFGRFPHRNQVMGRESTPEESAFLAQPGSGF
jgi:uncharacterized protein (DUF924 family)